MTKTTLLSILFALASLCVRGEDPKGGQVLLESQTPKTEEKKVPITQPKPASEILGTRVFYGGYVMDFLRTEKKRSLFNLKAPLDPPTDSQHLVDYPGKEAVKGLVLFSIKF